MSCCPSTGSCGCPVQPCPTLYLKCLPRVAFGVMLAGYGVNHYMNIEGFAGYAAGAFPTVSALAMISGLLAYVVPALQIVGGVLFAINKLNCLAKTCVLTALSGIIGWAGLAVLVGDANAGPAMMPAIQNAAILIVLFSVVKKMSCCGACPVTASK